MHKNRIKWTFFLCLTSFLSLGAMGIFDDMLKIVSLAIGAAFAVLLFIFAAFLLFSCCHIFYVTNIKNEIEYSEY